MTTVELLVIVAILALMSGMAFMAYHNYHKESLVASTAFQIQKLLSTARTQAIRSETVCGATFLLGQDHRLFWLDEDYDVASGGFDRPKITTPEPVNDFVELEIVDIATTTTQAENPVLSV
ncbi:hypothetical protein HQ520_11910, partial [bacterium]|nr:hypothetical protein [bacterium]